MLSAEASFDGEPFDGESRAFWRCVVLGVGSVFVVVGCGGSYERSARDASVAFGRSASEKNVEATRTGLAAETQLRLSNELVKKLLLKYEREHEALARELREGAYDVRVEVNYPLSAGRSVAAISSNGYYSIEVPREFVGAAEDPRATLVSLRDALERLSERDLLELLVPERREALAHMLATLREELVHLEDANLVERSGKIIVRFPSGLSLVLRRIGERYFVEELE